MVEWAEIENGEQRGKDFCGWIMKALEGQMIEIVSTMKQLLPLTPTRIYSCMWMIWNINIISTTGFSSFIYYLDFMGFNMVITKTRCFKPYDFFFYYYFYILVIMLCLGKFVFILVKLILIKIYFFFTKSKEQLDWKNKEFLTILLFYDGHEKLDGK